MAKKLRLSPEFKQAINLAIKNLPIFPKRDNKGEFIKVNRAFSGSHLIESWKKNKPGQSPIDAAGLPIDPRKSYVFAQYDMIDKFTYFKEKVLADGSVEHLDIHLKKYLAEYEIVKKQMINHRW